VGGPLSQFAGWVELMAGDAVAAERELRAGFERLTEIGEMSWLSTVAGLLGEALWLQGRDEEAAAMADACREAAPPDDAYSQAVWRSVAAKVRLRAGRPGEATRLASEAVDIASTTDFPHLRWHCQLTLAHVLRETDRKRAAEAADSADAIARAKGITVNHPLAGGSAAASG
jgi:ATP/maltotriose-dependent transcriptional regulator MalT